MSVVVEREWQWQRGRDVSHLEEPCLVPLVAMLVDELVNLGMQRMQAIYSEPLGPYDHLLSQAL